MPPRTKQDTEIVSIRLPTVWKDWLHSQGGATHGAISKTFKRLLKEEAWRLAGKYVELPREEYDAMRAELTKLRGKVRAHGKEAREAEE